jgi:hypothetical protein
MARSMTTNEASALEKTAGVVLSELELVLPVTEFTILVHALVHVPAQLAWFGPACTTWMFSFERFFNKHNTTQHNTQLLWVSLWHDLQPTSSRSEPSKSGVTVLVVVSIFNDSIAQITNAEHDTSHCPNGLLRIPTWRRGYAT